MTLCFLSLNIVSAVCQLHKPLCYLNTTLFRINILCLLHFLTTYYIFLNHIFKPVFIVKQIIVYSYVFLHQKTPENLLFPPLLMVFSHLIWVESTFTQLLYLSAILTYFYFTWLFPFYVILYFYYTIFQMLYFHCTTLSISILLSSI